eukprot:TRINITY_DN91068_c0_g1_i1.p1 TRINITY_DN91068_c0_g1~~TRINITY_DN91068_c0_g1_i1.p1  ORF type:complete len:584 (-),score=91.58 TRINITY_DN91068_c0_g1_i1:119-1870(-)
MARELPDALGLEALRQLNSPVVKASYLAPADVPLKRISALSVDKVASSTEATRSVLPREKLLAEFVGTYFLVLTVGISAASGSALAAFAVGGVLCCQVYTFASVSGGLFNPAVTLAVLLSGRQKLKLNEALAYGLVQMAAGVLAGMTSFVLSDKAFSIGWVVPGEESAMACGSLEAIYTMALCNIFLAACTSFSAPNQYFGVAIGAAVTSAIVLMHGLHQASLNPAITIGMNLASVLCGGASSSPSILAWLVFLLAPFLGAAVSAVIFRLTRSMEFCTTRSSSSLRHSLRERLLAEAVGTFMLVLSTCLGVSGGHEIAPLAVAGVVAVQIYTFGPISGSFFNPAMTFAMYLSGRGKLALKTLAVFVSTQLFAAAVGAIVGWFVAGSTFSFDYATHSTGPGWASGACLEVLYTCVLTGITLSSGSSFDAPNDHFGLSTASAVLAAAAGLGSLDQASLNPAVTFGVNLADMLNVHRTEEPSTGQGWLLYMFAPFAGAALGCAIFFGTRSVEYDFAEKTRLKTVCVQDGLVANRQQGPVGGTAKACCSLAAAAKEEEVLQGIPTGIMAVNGEVPGAAAATENTAGV